MWSEYKTKQHSKCLVTMEVMVEVRVRGAVFNLISDKHRFKLLDPSDVLKRCAYIFILR